MKAIIDWSIEMDEVYEMLDKINPEEATELLDIKMTMSDEEKHNYVESLSRHCPGKIYEFLGLPEEVNIPKDLKESEDITNWLSDSFGYCIEGYSISD